VQRKDIGKRLADGVSAKLEFDYVCERGQSFSEYHLHGVMNEIICAITSPRDCRTHSGYAHDALARDDDQKVGRQREVDFYVQAYDSSSSNLAIEAKWAESGHCKWDRILLDLCRLALVRQHSPTTECLFVLSGPTEKVEAALRSLEKNMPLRKFRGVLKGILEAPDDNRNPVPRYYHLRDWGGRFAGNEFVKNALPKKRDGRPNIPVKINTALVRSSGTRSNDWQTIVWRIF
jgi:hypothetical protein